MSFQSCSFRSMVGVRFVRPAALTRISTFPNLRTTDSSNASSDARSMTSEVNRRARRPRASASRAAESTCSARRDVGTTSAPASANASMIARPRPEVPPITTATLSFNSRPRYPICISLRLRAIALALRALPIEHCSVEFAVYGQVCPLVRKALRQFFVEIDSKPRTVSGMKISILEIIGMRKDFIGFRSVTHVFLNAEIIHRCIEVQRRGHGHRRQVGRTVTPGAHVINLGQSRYLLQMRYAAAVNNRHANVIDQLLANEYTCIPDSAENLANRQRRCRVLAHDPVTFLKLSGHGVFQPE